MLRLAIEELMQGRSLSEEMCYQTGTSLLQGADPHQIAAFLALLRAKGETVEELLGLLTALRKQAIPLTFPYRVLDIVGTGGDGVGTANISTGSALLAAASGIPVVKHGNRAVSSQCGSADVLEALGIEIHLSPDELKKSVAENNFGFCFAPNYHPALQALRPIRKGLNFKTVFHLLGPLLNPANAEHLLLGVADASLVRLMAEVLFQLGTKRSLVFYGHQIDELSCLGPIDALLVTEKGIEPFHIDPEALGLQKCTIEDLMGKDSLFNAEQLKRALLPSGSPLTDTLILNAGAALFIYGKTASLQEGVLLVKERLKKGNVLKPNHLQEILLRKRGFARRARSLKEALQNHPRAIIGEIKRASPTAGKITEIPDPASRAKEYARAGVAAISILTDEAFEGSFSDLTAVSKSVDLPILCKDFLLSPEQIAQAAQAGADAVLLIVAALGKKTKELVQLAHLFGMEALVEVHHEKELEIALDSGADLIGVNQRDLRDFSMHPELFTALIQKIPAHYIKIAESGIRSLAEAEKLFSLGYNAVLVGEALSRETFFQEALYAH